MKIDTTEMKLTPDEVELLLRHLQPSGDGCDEVTRSGLVKVAAGLSNLQMPTSWCDARRCSFQLTTEAGTTEAGE